MLVLILFVFALNAGRIVSWLQPLYRSSIAGRTPKQEARDIAVSTWMGRGIAVIVALAMLDTLLNRSG